jgi:transposase InsO family protein
LMRENRIIVERTRKFKATTDSDHTFNIAPNLLERDFTADRPNQKWAGDISYIWTREGWLYLAVLDLHSRRVIGWAVSDRLKRDLALRALKMAIALRSPPRGCVFHSDRGSQYCSYDYQKILRDHGLRSSMSGKGNCHDMPLSRRSSKLSRPSWSGAGFGKPVAKPEPPSFNTSTASITRAEGIQHWEAKPPGLRTPSSLNRKLGRHKIRDKSNEKVWAVLDDYLEGYNTRQPSHRRGMNWRTPIRAFTAGMPKTSNTEVTSQTKTAKLKAA